MSRWYRAYEGTVTDAKLGEVALIAAVSRSVAIATWHAILENCASLNQGGRFDIPPRRVAAALGEPVAAIEGVFAGLKEAGLTKDNVVVAWPKRQFESDNSTERSRKHRETKRNGDATLQQQHATPPETETYTEKKDDDGGEARERAKASEAFNLAADLASLCGYPSPQDWPPGWCGSPHWVQKCLNEGWSPEIMLAETEAVTKRKRDGPVDNFHYLEKPLARAQARHSAPLPKVEIREQETIHAHNGPRPNGLAASLARLGEIANDLERHEPVSEGGEAPPRLLSHG